MRCFKKNKVDRKELSIFLGVFVIIVFVRSNISL